MNAWHLAPACYKSHPLTVCAVIGMRLHPQLSEVCGPEMAQKRQNLITEAQG